jgi:hypothetical protein
VGSSSGKVILGRGLFEVVAPRKVGNIRYVEMFDVSLSNNFPDIYADEDLGKFCNFPLTFPNFPPFLLPEIACLD